MREVCRRSAAKSASLTYRILRADLATGSCQLVLSGHTSPALCVALLRCGSVVSGSLERVVRVWRAPPEAAVEGDEEAPSACTPALLLRGHTDSVRCVGQLLDGRLYSGSDDGTLRLWGEQEGRPDATLRPGAAVLAVAQLPVTGQLLTGSADRLLRLWQLPPPSARAAPAVPASAALLCLAGHGGAINAIALLPPGGTPDAPQRCVTGGADGLLCLWDLSAGQLLRTCAGHSGAVSACGVHPSGVVVSASMDRTVRLWGAQLATCEGTLEGHTHWINALLLLPDGRILTAASDRTLRFWRDGACERVLPQPTGEEALAEAVSMLSPAPAEACDYGQWSTPKPSTREEAPEDAGADCECASQHSDATEQMQRSEEPPPAWWGTPPAAMAAAASTGAVALLVLALTLRRAAAPPVRPETQARRRAGR